MTKSARSERRSFKEYMVKSFNSAKRGLEKSRSPKTGLEEPSPTESGFEAADSAESGLQSGSAQSGVKWYREDQALGNKIGDIDVQCTYEPKKARWVLEKETKPSRIPEEGTNPSGNFEEKKDLSGMLLFEIRFKDLGNHLQWATVTIDVGTPHNIDTLPIIEKAAPKDVITGNATDQHVHKATHVNPKLGIEAVGIGANAEVGQRGNEIEMTISNRWFFNAGTPSQGQPGIYQTEFNWSRTSHEDQMASKRRYIGALQVGRVKENTSLRLKVHVEVMPWEFYHRIAKRGSKERLVDGIGPVFGLESTLWPEPQRYKDLEEYIFDENSGRAITSKSTSHSIVFPATTNTY